MKRTIVHKGLASVHINPHPYMIRLLPVPSTSSISRLPTALLSRRMSLRNTGLSRIAAPQQLEIDLTDTEDTLCNLLNDCAGYLKQEKGISTTCRIAGGWVRDKVNPMILPPLLESNRLLCLYYSYLVLKVMILMWLSVT